MTKRISFLVAVFFSTVVMAGNGGDTLRSRKSVRLEIGGISCVMGVVYEQPIKKKFPEKHLKAYNSCEAGLSFGGFYDYSIMPGLGIKRNWSLTKHNKIIFYTGIYGGPDIALDPTPKKIREYDKEHNDYGGRYVNPVEPLLFAELGTRFCFRRLFLTVDFTPVLYHNPYRQIVEILPWGGISFGLNLKS